MTSWTRIREVFEAALELDELERERLLEEQCGTDTGLRSEVLRLLAADDSGAPAIERLASDLLLDLGRAGASPGGKDPLIGRWVGAYKITAVLASGGQGTVYEAQQDHPARRVAIKVMKRELASPEGRRRFEYETATLARLRHPGIAQIFEAGSFRDGPASGELPFFAMEYIEGARTIIDHANREELDVRQRLQLFANVCSTVHYGHQQGVIHRDLKPRNILVDYLGRPKVIDFGIARAVDTEKSETRHTRAGEILGTVQYMSPEQMSGDPDAVDTRSDIYALGVVLYELLTGSSPFPLVKTSLIEAARIVATTEPVRPDRVRPDLPKDLVWITLKTLEKDRERRYASAAELAEEIQRVLANQPVHAVPPSVRYRLKKFLQRNRREAIVGGLLFAAVTIGPVITSLSLARVNEQLQVANARYGRLADSLRLEELTQRAADMWPATPDRVAEMRAWVAEAQPVMGRLETHKQTLAALEQAADANPSAEIRWQSDVLGRLVVDLERFSDPDPEIGTFAGMEQRLGWATSIVRRSVDDHRAAWEQATQSVAQSDVYGGLVLAPQVGLVPLGPDPQSGLWEFAHIESGEIPARNAEGRLEVGPETGLVFVLIPGGTFAMGAVPPSTLATEMGARDPFAAKDESPARSVALAPFFLAKHEMSQAQWERLAGENPSYFTHTLLTEASPLTDLRTSRMHPVEQVSWQAATSLLHRFALDLPTEAQWEYAARAGTRTVWWTGDERESLRGVLNIADRAARRANQDWTSIEDWPDLEDGYPFHAPVDAFPANPFGLHNILGNVYEWCRDGFADYAVDPAPGTGERIDPNAHSRVLRGGSFLFAAHKARSAERTWLAEETIDLHVGLRAARKLSDTKP